MGIRYENQKGTKIMKCLVCKTGTMTPSTATYFADLKNCMIIVKNVPCQRCDQCGEVLYSASVSEKLYTLVEKAEVLASELTILEYDRIA